MDAISLEKYVEIQLGNLEKNIQIRADINAERIRTLQHQNEANESLQRERFLAIEKATALAGKSMDHRLDAMNAFRDQLNHQAATFLTRTEADERVASGHAIGTQISARIGAIEVGYPTRIELEKQLESANTARNILVDRVSFLERGYANLQGRIWAMSVGITIISIASSITLHFIH